MTPLKICVITNFSSPRCGIANFGHQTATALAHAGHAVTAFDGTYATIYARQQAALADCFFPDDLETYDVVHLIWHAITLNHYTGADWARLAAARAVKSFWDCGPSDAYCPFDAHFPVKWMLYPRDGYHVMDYPAPDWVTDLPPVDEGFVVGASSVRGDGIDELRAVCDAADWPLTLPVPGRWLSIEDEIRRLARATVNVCWYNRNQTWKDRASAPSMLLASGRPLLINEAELLAHLWGRADLYHGSILVPDGTRGLGPALRAIEVDWRHDRLRVPTTTARDLRWTTAAARMTAVWEAATHG
jgi:hypothetical protein